MKDSQTTQLLQQPVWTDPRIHLLDDLWLLTTFAVLFASAIPWLVSGLAIEFLPAAAGLLVLSAIHLALAAMASRAAPLSRWRPRVLAALHVCGMLAIAYIWQHVGGLQNPLFLALFALPVVGSIFISRWQPYLVAALAMVVVGLIAALELPALRSYAPGLDQLVTAFARVLGNDGAGTPLPFAGFYAPSEYFVVLLEVFAVAIFACAVTAEYLGTVFERLHDQVAAALSEAQRGEQLWSALLERMPLPALVVDADTCEIVFASSAALARFDRSEEQLAGQSLLATLNFSYPELVHELVSGAGGVIHPCMLRLDGQLLATEVRVHHLAQKGRRLALVIVQDRTEDFCIQAALNAAEHAAIVVDSQGGILSWNKPATALIPGAASAAEIARLLPDIAPGTRWWDPGLSGRRKMLATVMQRVYQLTISAVPLPGETERLYVVAFLPATQVAAEVQEGTATTTRKRFP
jgi:PAS domain-containing protein